MKKLDISNRHSWKITSAGLQHIKSLVKLQELDISGTSVKEEGLKYIASLRELCVLRHSLSNHITDDGLQQLRVHLPNLKTVLLF